MAEVVAGRGDGVDSATCDGSALTVRLRYPRPCGVLKEDGAVVFVERLENRVRVLRGGRVVTLAGGEEGFEDGHGAKFNYPSSGKVFGDAMIVADRDNSRLRTIRTNDGEAKTFCSFRDGMRPCDVAVVSSNEVYATATDSKDGAHCIVHAVAGNEKPTVVAGKFAERGFADGPHARFWLLYAAALGPDGRLYLADSNRVRVWDPRTREVATIAGMLTPGLRDGPLREAKFFTVRGIAVDNDLTIYVSDFGNDRIRAIDLKTRTVRSVASTPTPYSLVIDDDRGALYAGTGDEIVVKFKIPSKRERWTEKVAPILLAFYLHDRRRAVLSPPPARRLAFSSFSFHQEKKEDAFYRAIEWLVSTRGSSYLLRRILSFAY